MKNEPVKLLDVVALLVDKPAEGLVSGHVGTVVEVFSPEDFEVEFLDPRIHRVSAIRSILERVKEKSLCVGGTRSGGWA